MAGVTEQGFIRKSREEIISDLETKYKTQFGSDIDLSILSEDGVRLRILADELDEIYQLTEDVFYSNFAHTAKGVSLDRVLNPLGSERQPAKRAIVGLRFSGVNGSFVNIGTICQTGNGLQFITIESGTVSGGTVLLNAQALNLNYGILGNVAANSITTINTAITGIDTVTNPEPGREGRVIETDSEYLNRFLEEGINGGSSAANVQGALNNIESVLSARVYENVTDFVDVEGRNPHSMEAVIEGGTPAEIGDCFLKNWPGGIESIGTYTTTLIDNKGVPRTYYFNRPTDISIFVKIDIVRDLSLWETGSESIVKTNCIKVVGGVDTIGPISISYKGDGTGEDVFAWKLIASQSGLSEYDSVKVLGIKSMTVKVGLSAPATLDELIISSRQRAKLVTANIQVNFL
ncbi:baseplate J/gp47 family protein [Leptospira interrogans]|uniref:baseplate J/gp47 family protein n=1 Tax=Leptospira interrogans TaxID=173 RepID=UPI0002BA5A0F|nr:baseplate J/gp47 family protein [Leptospira interrogans]MCR8649044.1 phage baseplate protein [Leptospira interrogans serovar Bataviae]OAM74216.1 phage baseplate protein [Leptospira interrogans serovar Bataviae]QOI36844.1 phage baseplate protein [Leptospira interrogans serovar Bataviae]QOI38337.1 phage baseplate protein [Leptospira interrogans serovar Bataviae]QYY60441.1 baseplate J/gp47 family protein [Leptospira interrogans serovar Bataviae]